MPTAYVELTARSNFSFLQAASSPEALVDRAADLGFDTIAVTDRDGLYGAVRAFAYALLVGFHGLERFSCLLQRRLQALDSLCSLRCRRAPGWSMRGPPAAAARKTPKEFR